MLLEKLMMIIFLIISYILQFSIDLFVLGNISPDFLLILTVYFATYRGDLSGLWVGFFAGLFQDINLGGYFSLSSSGVKYYTGTYALPKALVGYFSGKFYSYLRKESNLMIFISLFILSIGKDIMVLCIVIIFHHGIDINILLSIVLPEAIYTGIVGIFWFKLLKIVFPIMEETIR